MSESAPGNGQPSQPMNVVRNYISLAIQIGAPAYNLGDHRGCYEVYACTARLLLRAMRKVKETLAARQRLRRALHRASTQGDVNQQAWTMRHAFDDILADSEPSTDDET